MSVQDHWDEVYGRLGAEGVSWYQSAPATSLALIDAAGLTPDRSVIDVGGGASPLTGALAARGYGDLTVLDLSEVALARSREGLARTAERVRWIRADVREWEPERTYDLWHDRAAFHFLVDPIDRERYLRALASSLEPGASLIVAAFSPAAPPRCSGLSVARYDAFGLASAFGPAFSLQEARDEEHVTPRGRVQPFTWALLRRL